MENWTKPTGWPGKPPITSRPWREPPCCGRWTNSNTPTNSSVSITQIPFSYYDLDVYFSSDVAGRTGTVTDGTTRFSFTALGKASITNASGNAVLTRTTDTGTGYPAANYAVFTGLSGGSKTINCNIPLYGGIAGFQLVPRTDPLPGGRNEHSTARCRHGGQADLAAGPGQRGVAAKP